MRIENNVRYHYYFNPPDDHIPKNAEESKYISEQRAKYRLIADRLGAEIFYEQARSIFNSFDEMFYADYEQTIWHLTRKTIYD